MAGDQRHHRDLHTTGAEFADNHIPPPGETARGQLLRVMASDAMRGAIKRRYGVWLAFQNFHVADRLGERGSGSSDEPVSSTSPQSVQTRW